MNHQLKSSHKTVTSLEEMNCPDTPGNMLNSILEENQLGLLGEGHIVIIEVVLQNSLDLIHVR